MTTATAAAVHHGYSAASLFWCGRCDGSGYGNGYDGGCGPCAGRGVRTDDMRAFDRVVRPVTDRLVAAVSGLAAEWDGGFGNYVGDGWHVDIGTHYSDAHDPHCPGSRTTPMVRVYEKHLVRAVADDGRLRVRYRFPTDAHHALFALLCADAGLRTEVLSGVRSGWLVVSPTR